jgi:hypothetical protein
VSGDFDASVLKRSDLIGSASGAAFNNGTCMAHSLAGRGGLSSDKANDGFSHFCGNEFSG